MDLLSMVLLAPLVTAILCILCARSLPVQRALAVAGMAVLLGTGVLLMRAVYLDGVQAVQLGNWPAPYGITLVADMFSAIMVTVSAFVGLCGAVYSLSTMNRSRERFGYYAFLHFMMVGVCGAFLTGDLFNLFVWFEVMLISSFVLMILGGERQQMEGAVKYVTLNLIASSLFLTAIGILYGKTGTLNMADLSLQLAGDVNPHVILLVSMLFLFAFGVKAGLFPLYFWLPASYHTPHVAVSAMFSGLLTKVGAYSLIRIFTTVFDGQEVFTNNLLMLLAALTMVSGVLGAVVQFDFRRLLSFHIISQIGYAVMGLALHTPLAIAGAIYFLVHNIFAKTNLFLVSGAAFDIRGTYDLKKMGGLFKGYPALTVIFMIAAFSLAGMPPLSGFFGKLALIFAGVQKGYETSSAAVYVLTGVALAVGLLTLYSMTKIFAEAFWKKPPAQAPEGRLAWSSCQGGKRYFLYAPMVAMAAMTVLLGLFAEPCLRLCLIAAEQLLDPSEYIQAVLRLKP